MKFIGIIKAKIYHLGKYPKNLYNLGKYPKTWYNLGKYPFGIRSYLGNDTFGILSVWDIIIWEKIPLGKYPTAVSSDTFDFVNQGRFFPSHKRKVF